MLVVMMVVFLGMEKGECNGEGSVTPRGGDCGIKEEVIEESCKR